MKEQGRMVAQIRNTIYPDTAQNDINFLLRCLQAEKAHHNFWKRFWYKLKYRWLNR